MEIFEQVGLAFLSRWLHILSGITWIGLLYYFNFVQVPAFAEFEAAARTEALRKLAPRALWWFRWGAVATVATGLLILGFQEHFDGDYVKTPAGMSIFTGALIGLVMAANVWGVIWPNQKTVMASAEGVAAGREADPNAAPAGRKALLASRQNTIFSIPLLFFMAATSHFAGSGGFNQAPESGDRMLWWIVVLVVVLLLELNALGVLGGTGDTALNKIYANHKNAITAGFVITILFYVVFEIAFSA